MGGELQLSLPQHRALVPFPHHLPTSWQGSSRGPLPSKGRKTFLSELTIFKEKSTSTKAHLPPRGLNYHLAVRRSSSFQLHNQFPHHKRQLNGCRRFDNSYENHPNLNCYSLQPIFGGLLRTDEKKNIVCAPHPSPPKLKAKRVLQGRPPSHRFQNVSI